MAVWVALLARRELVPTRMRMTSGDQYSLNALCADGSEYTPTPRSRPKLTSPSVGRHPICSRFLPTDNPLSPSANPPPVSLRFR